jgi:hypothetical protein
MVSPCSGSTMMVRSIAAVALLLCGLAWAGSAGDAGGEMWAEESDDRLHHVLHHHHQQQQQQQQNDKTDDEAPDVIPDAAIVFHVTAADAAAESARPESARNELRSLAEAAEAVERTLAEQPSGSTDIVVELGPGAHRVPHGGLQLGSKHSPQPSPSSPMRRVVWRASEAGRSSIHGGAKITGANGRREVIESPLIYQQRTQTTIGTFDSGYLVFCSGWRPSTDPALPAGVLVASLPAALKGQRLRHLYVNGVRASRTRIRAAHFNLTLTAVMQERSEEPWSSVMRVGGASGRSIMRSIGLNAEV